MERLSTAYAVCMLVSVFCLLLGFLVYVFIPELRNVHGKILMCHMASLLFGYSAMATKELAHGNLPLEACVIVGKSY